MPNPNHQLTLALFDLDKTLIPFDSDHAWGEFMIGSGWVDEASYRQTNNQFYEDYQQARLDPRAYLRFCLAPLATAPMSVWQHRRDAYLRQTLLPLFKSSALVAVFDVLKQHRDRGDTLMMITATNAFITRPIAKMFGFDHLIAVEPCLSVDRLGAVRYTGDFEGEPTFNVGKCTALENYLLKKYGLKQLVDGASLIPSLIKSAWFYSDSINDLPLLSRVGHPVVVNADQALRAYALKHNWLELDWFNEKMV